MKLKPILFGLMILLFTALVSAGANDPSRFGNLTDTTVMIGGAEGIIWTNGSNTFYVNDSLGKIGIGTSTPSEKLYIQDTGAAATVYIRGGDGNGVSHNAQIKLDADNDAAIFFVLNGSTSYLLSADRSDNLLRLTNGSFSNIFTIDQAGTAFFDGNVGIGKTNPATVLDVDGLVNASEYSGAINWSYNQNYPGACPANTYVTTIGDSITCTAITEITNNVTIAQTFFDNNTGNVGIGTTSPQSPLHITDTRPELTLQSDYNESAVQGYYKILDNGSNLYAFAGLDSDSNNDFTIRTTTYAAGIDFQTNSSSRIYIAKGGNVGIGTIAPSEKFDVVGNIKATGTIVGVWENGLSDDGLILNIPANEDALDYSGQGNDGTLYNDTTYTTGKFGESFSFDGVNDYVDMGDTDSLSFGDGTNDFPLTVSAWVYSTQTDINDYVLSKGIGYTSGEYSFYIAVGTIYLRICDASASKYQQAYYEGSLPLNEWVYISATYDGRGGDNAASGISIYYNGNEVTTGINENAGYVAMENGAEPLVLGKYSTSFFNGSIDDVKIFNRSLSSDEIKALYSQSAEFYGRNSFRSTMGSVGIGTVSPTSKLEITQNNNELGLLIENAGNQHGIRVTQTGELASGFRALYLYSAALLDNGAELVKFYSDNPSSTDDVVELRNDGTGNGLFIDQNGNGASISIDSEAATQNMISWTSANTDRGVKITNPAAFTGTSNPGFFYVQLSSASSTKPLMTLENAGTGEGVFIDQNGNGIALNIDSEATTNSAVFVDQAINNDASIINVKQNGQNAFRVYRNDDVETNTTITIGNYFLWVDSTGDLRINNGQPTSDTDGTVVGAQT